MDGEEESLSAALQNLRENGLRHHMSKDWSTNICKVSLRRVHLISVLCFCSETNYANGRYDYSVYRGRPTNALVPLEVF